MNETGKIIRQLRKEAGYTQSSLATALHVTTQAVSKWERGFSLPDVALLPKLSLLLDADMDLLVSRSIEQDEWVGLLDILGCDFSQTVYDKPLVYYLLAHFALLGIRHIHVLTDAENRQFLMKERFRRFGFRFCFDPPADMNTLIMQHPWFVFGSDLTRQFQGAMVSDKSTMLVPENQKPVFFCCRKDDLGAYFQEKERFAKSCAKRTLGRGMICFDMSDSDKALDVAGFVRTYQKNAGLLIGSLEEIAMKQGLITAEEAMGLAENSPYRDELRKLRR